MIKDLGKLGALAGLALGLVGTAAMADNPARRGPQAGTPYTSL